MIGACLVICAVVLARDAPESEKPGAPEARLRREYPPAAAELERIARNFVAKGTVYFRYFIGDAVLTSDFTIASSGDKRLLVLGRRTSEAPPPRKELPGEVYCRTPEHAFGLSKELASPAAPYVLLYHSRKAPAGSTIDSDFHRYARCATWYDGMTLLERMRDPEFVLRAVEAVAVDGHDLVRVDYTLDHKERGSESGAVYLDPNLSWAIRRAELTVRHKDTVNTRKPESRRPEPIPVTIEVEYQELPNGLHFPKRMERVSKPKIPDRYQLDRMELTEVTVGNVSDDIFKLTAYGLPDVPLRPVRGVPLLSFRSPLFWGCLTAMAVSLSLLWWTRRLAGKPRGSALA